MSEIEREMTRLRKDLAAAKADATTNLLHYHAAVDEAERLRSTIKSLHKAVLNPCRFPNPAPCGNCEACHDIQMALEASREAYRRP